MSVVVATRDRPRWLLALLDSLRAQTLGRDRFEVIVVDDGSAEDPAEAALGAAAKAGIDVRVLRQPRPAGPARARNRGWRAARAPVVAFTDDDCEAAPGWLAAGLEALQRRDDVIVQGRVQPQPRELHLLGPFSRSLEINPPTPWFETASIIYPRVLLERLDGFDEAFPEAAGEDTDLGWRALELGAEVVAAPEALVFHHVEVLGPRRRLRLALRGADAVLAFKRHPELRARSLRHRHLWKESHGLIVLAAAGAAASRGFRPAAALTAPYALDLLRRSRAHHASPAFVPFLAATDLLELYSAVRGSLRHRILLI